MKRSPAFTLFEVLIAMTIFFLLAGGIFATVRSAFTASAEVASSQLDAERANAFQALMRKMFGALPADAKLETRVRKEPGRGDVVELLIWPAPPFLRFGSGVGDGAAISALPDGRGQFNLSLASFRVEDSADERDRDLAKAGWLPLLPGVGQVRWRFAPPRNPVMAEAWNAGSGRPGLAELTLRMAGGTDEISSYWVPPLQRRSSGAIDPGPVTGGGPEGSAPPEGAAGESGGPDNATP